MTFDIFPFTLTLLMKSTLQLILTLAELFKMFPSCFFQVPLSSSYLINALWLETTKTFKIT